MAASGFNTPSWRPASPAPELAEDFSLPALTYTCDGILFDMDGTLIDSTDAVVKHWEAIGKQFGVDPRVILATSHGRRSIDVLKDISPEHANPEYISKIEREIPHKYGASAKELPGARSILASLGHSDENDSGSSGTAAAPKWTIVTSGTRGLVEGWLKVLGLPPPAGGTMVTADDVKGGKPDPEPYLLGRERLGLKEGEVLVVEDAPAGVKAGKAAGCKVLALATTHRAEELWGAGADWIVKDLGSVRLKSVGRERGTLQLEFRNGLRN